MANHRILGSALLFSLLVLAARPAAAQSGGAAAAEALFNEARVAMDAKDYAKACTRFRESNRLDPAVGTVLNLAACEETRGHLATAWELFRAAWEKLAPSDQRRDFAKGRADALEPRLPKIVMKLAEGAPKQTTVREGETEYGEATFGLPIPVNPGKLRLVVEAPGHEPREVEVEVVEAARITVDVVPGPKVPETAAPVTPAAAPSKEDRPTPATPGSDTTTLGWVLGGVGVAGVATGVTFGVLALGKKSITDEECSTSTEICSREGGDARDSGRTFALVSTVGWIVGGLGLAGGAYFLLTSDTGSGSQTALAVTPTTGGAEFSVLRRF